MAKVSLDKDKIKILLLEGVHPSSIEVLQQAGYTNIEELAVEGGDCPEDVDRLVERLGAIFPKERIYRSRATPVIGTHTGPGLILVAVLGDK